jgi:hypothetical protein
MASGLVSQVLFEKFETVDNVKNNFDGYCCTPLPEKLACNERLC